MKTFKKINYLIKIAQILENNEDYENADNVDIELDKEINNIENHDNIEEISQTERLDDEEFVNYFKYLKKKGIIK